MIRAHRSHVGEGEGNKRAHVWDHIEQASFQPDSSPAPARELPRAADAPHLSSRARREDGGGGVGGWGGGCVGTRLSQLQVVRGVCTPARCSGGPGTSQCQPAPVPVQSEACERPVCVHATARGSWDYQTEGEQVGFVRLRVPDIFEVHREYIHGRGGKTRKKNPQQINKRAVLSPILSPAAGMCALAALHHRGRFAMMQDRFRARPTQHGQYGTCWPLPVPSPPRSSGRSLRRSRSQFKFILWP